MTASPADGHDPLHAVHRFILLGRAQVFAYHLALFQIPAHQYQAVLEVDLTEPAKGKYLTDLDTPKDPAYTYFYTCSTLEHFPLVDIATGARRSLQVERVEVDAEGRRRFTPLAGAVGDIRVRNDGVRHFEPTGGPYPASLTYLLFGRGHEVYLAHQLARRPHWDEVIEATGFGGVDQATLDRVPTVTTRLPEHRDRLEASPLRRGSAYPAELARPGGGTTPVEFTVGEQRWWNHTTLNDVMPG